MLVNLQLLVYISRALNKTSRVHTPQGSFCHKEEGLFVGCILQTHIQNR